MTVNFDGFYYQSVATQAMPPFRSSIMKRSVLVRNYLCWLRDLLRSLNWLRAITRYFYLPVSMLVENEHETQIFYQQFVGRFDTSKNSKVVKISILKFISK